MKKKFCVCQRSHGLKVGKVVLFNEFLKPSSATGQIYVRRIMLLLSLEPRVQIWRYSSFVPVYATSIYLEFWQCCVNNFHYFPSSSFDFQRWWWSLPSPLSLGRLWGSPSLVFIGHRGLFPSVSGTWTIQLPTYLLLVPKIHKGLLHTTTNPIRPSCRDVNLLRQRARLHVIVSVQANFLTHLKKRPQTPPSKYLYIHNLFILTSNTML